MLFLREPGDPFTVTNAYDDWVRVKAARKESSRRWCKRHGLQEQRLYEITKLRRQFEELLDSSGLLRLGAAAQRARRGSRGRRGQLFGYGGSRASVDKIPEERLRALKRRKEGRKRKILDVRAEGAESGEVDGDDEEEARRELMEEVGEAGAKTEGLDLSSLEFYMAQDVGTKAGSGDLLHEHP